MKNFIAFVLLGCLLQVLPGAQAGHSNDIFSTTAEVVVRGSGGEILNSCAKPGRRVNVAVDKIQMPSGKVFSLYQPSNKQVSFHPNFIAAKGVKRLDDCAEFADKKGALMFEMRGHSCRIAFYQFYRYNMKPFCQRSGHKHFFMLENARNYVRDGLCTLKDGSLLKKNYDLHYNTECNRLTYTCNRDSGAPTTNDPVFDDTSFGCVYWRHNVAKDFHDGRAFCHQFRATLFVADNDDHRDAFLAYHKKVGAATTYIGLKMNIKHHTWHWIANNKPYTSTTGWAPGFPIKKRHLDCASVGEREGLVKNVPCGNKRFNVCYKEKKALGHGQLDDGEENSGKESKKDKKQKKKEKKAKKKAEKQKKKENKKNKH